MSDTTTFIGRSLGPDDSISVPDQRIGPRAEPMERPASHTPHVGGGLRGVSGYKIDTGQHPALKRGKCADLARARGMPSGMRMSEMADRWRYPSGTIRLAFWFDLLVQRLASPPRHGLTAPLPRGDVPTVYGFRL